MKSASKGIRSLSPTQLEELLSVLKDRFTQHVNRHKKIEWASVEQKLKTNAGKVWSVYEMNRTGGEPDVIGYDVTTDEFIVCDCSTETPLGRRSLCYDRKALDKRKENKPKGNAIDMATEMGVKLL